MECFEKLQQFYLFRVQIEKTDRILRSFKATDLEQNTNENGVTIQSNSPSN